MARRRRNPSIYPSEAAALRALLNRHGYSTNPGARPGENDIPTVRIKRRNPRRRKAKMFGPGKRWKTKRAMLRYLAKIRVKAMRVLRRKGKGRKVKVRRKTRSRRR